MILIRYIRYTLEALITFFLYAIFWALPMSASSFIGGWLGEKIIPLLKFYKVAKRNLDKIMPELSSAEQQTLLRGMCNNLGRIFAEMPHIASLEGKKFQKHVEIVDARHIDQLRDDNQPGIFISAHLGNWEVGPKASYERGLELGLVYRHANNPFVDRLILFSRRKSMCTNLPKGSTGARDLVRFLKEKGHIAMLMDQKMNDGISVPFFGHNAMTAPALVQLATKYDCPIVPCQVVRTKGTNFKVIIHPPLKIEETGDKNKDTLQFMTKVNSLMEGWIREHPEQWFWIHNRWKF